MQFDQYLDIPFKAKGRDHRGADCWGLVRIVAREQFGKHLPPLVVAEYDTKQRLSCARAIRKWRAYSGCRKVEGDPQPGDLVLMSTAGTESHVGICIIPGRILHTEEPYGPRVQKIGELDRLRAIVGVYRAD